MRQDWARISKAWTKRIDERIAELERLRAGLTRCIGCGCLSIDKCEHANPADRAGRRGPGPTLFARLSAVKGQRTERAVPPGRSRAFWSTRTTESHRLAEMDGLSTLIPELGSGLRRHTGV